MACSQLELEVNTVQVSDSCRNLLGQHDWNPLRLFLCSFGNHYNLASRVSQTRLWRRKFLNGAIEEGVVDSVHDGSKRTL
jgi:hypothetical protein